MSDNEFIDKLNDIIVNYGFIIIDMDNNYEYYFKRYNINKFFIEDFEFEDIYHHKFILFDIKSDMIKLEFQSIYLMLNGSDESFSIFKWIEMDMNLGGNDRWFPIEFSNFMMYIKGTSKEEIILKIQMLGY